MSNTINTENATVSILIELDGIVHLVAMSKDRYEAVSLLVKQATCGMTPTKRTQHELHDFLEVRK